FNTALLASRRLKAILAAQIRAAFQRGPNMRRKLTAFGGGAALVVAAITIPATTAAAAKYDIDFDIPDAWAQAESTLEWSISDAAADICDNPEILINGLPDV